MIRRRAILGCAVLVAALWPQAGLALGSTEVSLDSPDSHCVVDVVDQTAYGELIVSEPRCYETFAEAIRDASEDSVRLPVAATGSVMFTDEDVQSSLTSFALGIHYDGASGAGSSITVTGSSCTGGHWNTPTAWDNRISSSYNGCARLTHYDGANKAGAKQDTVGTGATHNLTTLNNKTESVSYHSS